MFQVTKTDPFLPFIFKFLKFHRNIKHLCTIFTIILTVLIVPQTYQLCRYPSPEVVLKYGTFYLSCIYVVCINTLYLSEAEQVNKILSSFKPLFIVNTENILDQTTTKIKVIVARTNALLVIWFSAAVFCVEALMYYNCIFDKGERMLIVVFLKQYTNCSSFVIELIKYAAFISVQFACICSTVPIYFIYINFYLKLNLIILTDQVKRFNNNLRRSGPSYQKAVIKFITREFLKINSYTLDIMEVQQVKCILFVCAGLLVGFMGCCTFFSPNSSKIEALSIFTAYFLFGITGSCYVQTFENDCVDLYDAILDLNWYEWDVESQKMYLTVVTNTCKIMHFRLFWVVDINHDLLKRLCRFIYAAVNLFYSFG